MTRLRRWMEWLGLADGDDVLAVVGTVLLVVLTLTGIIIGLLT